MTQNKKIGGAVKSDLYISKITGKPSPEAYERWLQTSRSYLGLETAQNHAEEDIPAPKVLVNF